MTELLIEGEDIDQAFPPLSLIFPSRDVDRGLSENLGAMKVVAARILACWAMHEAKPEPLNPV